MKSDASSMPFVPDDLPITTLDWERLAPYAHKAAMALARYDGTLDAIVNPAVLLSPITSREAILSSRIEGTVASLTEVLELEAGQNFDEKKTQDIKEIINYRKALLTAEKYVSERSITLQLVREMHAMLMDDVRGGDKTPGQFRESQNYIAKKGAPIERARFVPPDPIVMRGALDTWQKFIESDYLNPLVQLAIIHAQFEIIHPFGDGNGRIGRMLIPLFLYRKNALQRPTFYLSEYLEEHDQEYRDRLLAITLHNDWQGWVEFFLNAIAIQADRNNVRAKKIHQLYNQLKRSFAEATRSQYSQAALDAFFKKPISNSASFQQLAKIENKGTASSILKGLTDNNLIQIARPGKGRRSTIYVLSQLILIAEGKEILKKASKNKGE